MFTRRAFLGKLSAAAVAAPALLSAGQASAFGAITPERRAAADALSMTIVNNSGSYGNDTIHFYVVGTNLDTKAQSYVTPDGVLKPVSTSLNGPDGYADLSIPLAAQGNTKIGLPSPMSGRVYFSLGSKLKFKVVTGGGGKPALQYPAGWVESDPSFAVLHDFVEFTHDDSGMYCNTTMVDMFSVPLSLTLDGSRSQAAGTLVDGGRDAIFSTIAGNSDFSGLVLGDKLRVIAPGHGVETGKFPGDYFDDTVNRVWSKYTSETLTVNTGSATYTGKVSGDTLTFSGGVKPISKPSTLDVLYCNGALAAPNDGVTGPVAAILGAGLNRTTLLDATTQPTTDPSGYYGDDVTNHYAKVMHDNTVDGKAYGFPFDDVAGRASYIQDSAPSALTVTLTPFS